MGATMPRITPNKNESLFKAFGLMLFAIWFSIHNW